MIFSPRLPPMYTWATATKMSPTAAARIAASGACNSDPIGPAASSATTATTTDTTNAIETARRTIARERPGEPLPTSIATRRTAAMSIPNRVAAPATNASCVISVICPKAADPAPNARATRMFIAKLATTNTPRPRMFWPVPDRIVRRSRACSARATSVASATSETSATSSAMSGSAASSCSAVRIASSGVPTGPQYPGRPGPCAAGDTNVTRPTGGAGGLTRNPLIAYAHPQPIDCASIDPVGARREEAVMSTTTPVPDEIHRELTIGVPRERVWAALTEPEQLVQWFPTKDARVDLRPGGELYLAWDEQSATGVFDTIEPPDRLVYRWFPGGTDLPATTVEFTLAPSDDGSGTVLTVVERGFAQLRPEHLAGNEEGWTSELQELVDYLNATLKSRH
jgi:uncharacterized protein YndB with AHSA1/START domain